MNCQELEQNLPLLLYGELSTWERAACEEHLAGCASCRAAREEMERLHTVLAKRPQIEVSAGLLAEARMELDEALETHPESPMATALSRFGGPNARY
jgi:predicted anti-sigma-YlaC factor YlaD